MMSKSPKPLRFAILAVTVLAGILLWSLQRPMTWIEILDFRPTGDTAEITLRFTNHLSTPVDIERQISLVNVSYHLDDERGGLNQNLGRSGFIAQGIAQGRSETFTIKPGESIQLIDTVSAPRGEVLVVAWDPEYLGGEVLQPASTLGDWRMVLAGKIDPGMKYSMIGLSGSGALFAAPPPAKSFRQTIARWVHGSPILEEAKPHFSKPFVIPAN